MSEDLSAFSVMEDNNNTADVDDALAAFASDGGDFGFDNLEINDAFGNVASQDTDSKTENKTETPLNLATHMSNDSNNGNMNNSGNMDDVLGFEGASNNNMDMGLGDDNMTASGLGLGDNSEAFGFGFDNNANNDNEQQNASSVFDDIEEDKQLTPLEIWQKERDVVLADRQAKAKAKKAQMLQDAVKDLEGWYSDREERLGRRKETNRKQEAADQEAYESLMENGTTWEKVAKLTDLSQGSTKDKSNKNNRDRLRKLLIVLKNDK